MPSRDEIQERYISRFIVGAPAAMYDLGVGHKSEWRTLREEYPEMALFGCEPHPRQYSKLCEVFPGALLPIAITAVEGRTTLYVGTEDDNTASLFRVGYDCTEHEVEAWTLDHFDQHCGQPDRILLWADIEGAEFEALQGGIELLSSGRVRWINLEERREGHRARAGWADPALTDKLLEEHGFIRKATYNRHRTHQDVVYVHQADEIPEGG